MRNSFFLFGTVLVLVSVLAFLHNKHFFSFIKLSPTEDDVLLLSSLWKAQPSNQYKYLMLVQQWPPSHCNNFKTCHVSPPGDFTIHGLWPDKTKCPGPSYTKIVDSGLLRNLKNEWPDLERGDNQGFWGHEWTDHGTCSYMDQTSYFKLTLKLKGKYDVLKYLVRKGIKPRSNTPYRVKEIRKYVYKLTGKKPALNCNNDRNGRRQLHEVRICFDPRNAVIDCPKGNNCNDQEDVYFPKK